MKVRITGHTDSDTMPWWYIDHIGETFEVVEDEEKPQYYLTGILEIEGTAYQRHIKKVDCEVVE
ncbi:hypothetical protein [Paenibacillus prosopidis]|uniref:Uncharacterized protein n=1 Tax=Paenibacillus prosopidis TaxID=630520 RepID=A0A368VVR9_9BACL|nr:hypothetical protein [Paenibacillus prosopidis]RCW44235.1 hypothetical protein DFP97_11299 [Paenibacillus prosopidis]